MRGTDVQGSTPELPRRVQARGGWAAGRRSGPQIPDDMGIVSLSSSPIPSPGREREGPNPQGWEGEGLDVASEGRIERARRLRQEKTRAEAILWRCLRRRALDGFKFRRQAPIDRYFADFACFESKLIIELDGGQHADAASYDARRTLVLEQAAYRVLRIWNHRVLNELDGTLQEISIALRPERP